MNSNKPIRIIGATRRTGISFYADGRIDLSAHAARLLDIRPGDAINIATDGEEYYLFVAVHAPKGRHHAQCRATARSGAHYRFNSVQLARAMLAVCGGKEYAHLPLGDVTTVCGYKAVVIITHLNIQ
jgi:hypothetical protein